MGSLHHRRDSFLVRQPVSNLTPATRQSACVPCRRIAENGIKLLAVVFRVEYYIRCTVLLQILFILYGIIVDLYHRALRRALELYNSTAVYRAYEYVAGGRYHSRKGKLVTQTCSSRIECVLVHFGDEIHACEGSRTTWAAIVWADWHVEMARQSRIQQPVQICDTPE